ncbi:hypothetical protein BC828DRAFT_412252 [Blastocladiella britannica]|nr:hypothetical protein BC828DRAFT_412252 [Blastocladiella britannica]
MKPWFASPLAASAPPTGLFGRAPPETIFAHTPLPGTWRASFGSQPSPPPPSNDADAHGDESDVTMGLMALPTDVHRVLLRHLLPTEYRRLSATSRYWLTLARSPAALAVAMRAWYECCMSVGGQMTPAAYTCVALARGARPMASTATLQLRIDDDDYDDDHDDGQAVHARVRQRVAIASDRQNNLTPFGATTALVADSLASMWPGIPTHDHHPAVVRAVAAGPWIVGTVASAAVDATHCAFVALTDHAIMDGRRTGFRGRRPSRTDHEDTSPLRLDYGGGSFPPPSTGQLRLQGMLVSVAAPARIPHFTLTLSSMTKPLATFPFTIVHRSPRVPASGITWSGVLTIEGGFGSVNHRHHQVDNDAQSDQDSKSTCSSQVLRFNVAGWPDDTTTGMWTLYADLDDLLSHRRRTMPVAPGTDAEDGDLSPEFVALAPVLDKITLSVLPGGRRAVGWWTTPNATVFYVDLL